MQNFKALKLKFKQNYNVIKFNFKLHHLPMIIIIIVADSLIFKDINDLS